MNTLEARLVEERKRFGLSQAAFGEAGGVQKRAQINYENGERRPDAAYLERLAAIGVDVLYVLTGRRAPAGNGYAAAEPSPVGHLTLPELGLIKGWRQLDARGRQAVIAMIEALTQAAPGQRFSGPVQNVAGRDVKHVTTGAVRQGKKGGHWLKQLISGPVQYVAGRDVVVVQQVVPSCLSAEELQLVLAHRAERARQWAQMGAQDASIEIQEG